MWRVDWGCVVSATGCVEGILGLCSVCYRVCVCGGGGILGLCNVCYRVCVCVCVCGGGLYWGCVVSATGCVCVWGGGGGILGLWSVCYRVWGGILGLCSVCYRVCVCGGGGYTGAV